LPTGPARLEPGTAFGGHPRVPVDNSVTGDVRPFIHARPKSDPSAAVRQPIKVKLTVSADADGAMPLPLYGQTPRDTMRSDVH
jgi:hypothetical protein